MDLITADPARKVGGGGRAADVGEKRDVVDVGALVRVAPEPVGEL
jgi:hypothetical protein